MAWQKSPPELVERFGRVLDRFPDLEQRKMFGYPAAFIGGNLVTSLHESDWVVRLPEHAQPEALGSGARVFEPMGGRTMRNFVAFPVTVTEDPDRIAGWVEQAMAHARTLPAKPRQKR